MHIFNFTRKRSFRGWNLSVYGANGIVGYLDSYNTSDEAIYIVKDGSGVGSVAYVKGRCSATGTLNILTAAKRLFTPVPVLLAESVQL